MSDDCEVYNRRFCDERHAAAMREIALLFAKVNLKIDAVREANHLVSKAADTARTLKTAELNKRLETLNALRAEVVKDREDFLRKDSYDAKVLFYDKFVADASQTITRIETRYENRITFATIMAVFSVVVALVAVILPWLMHK